MSGIPFEELVLLIDPKVNPAAAARLQALRKQFDEAAKSGQTLGTMVAPALDRIVQSTQKAAPGVKRIENALAALALQATGMQGPLGGVTSSLLMFSAGSATVIGIAAGLAIIGKAYQDLVEPIKAAEKAASDAQDTLLKTLRSADEESNPVRFAKEQLAGAQEQLRLLKEQQTRLETFAPNITNSRDRAANETNQIAVKANIAKLTVKLEQAETAAAKVAAGINQTFSEQQAAKIKATAAAAEAFRKQLEDMGNAATASLLDDTATAMARLLEQAKKLGVEGPELAKAMDALNEKLQQAQTLNLIGNPDDIATIEEAETVLANLRDLREKGVATSQADEAIQKRILVLLQQQAAATGEHANGAELITKNAREFEESVQKTKKSLEDQLDTATDIARGVIGMAQAFGLADDKAAALLQNVLSIADSIPGVLAGNPGSIFAAVGGILGTISSLFGSGTSPAEKARQDTLQKNTEALDRVRSGLEALGGGFSGDSLSKARALATITAQDIDARRLDGQDPATAIATGRLFGLTGISLKELNDIADEFHITLDGSKQSWLDLNAAIQDNDLRGFIETFEGLRQAIDLRADIFEQTDVQKLQALSKGAAGASPNLLGGLGGLDLTTAAGLAAASKIVEDVTERLLADQIGSADLGGMSRDQLEQTLRDLNDLINSANSGRVGGTTEQFGISQTITVAQASQINAYLSTISVSGMRTAEASELSNLYLERLVAQRFGEVVTPTTAQARALGDSAAGRALALGNNRAS